MHTHSAFDNDKTRARPAVAPDGVIACGQVEVRVVDRQGRSPRHINAVVRTLYSQFAGAGDRQIPVRFDRVRTIRGELGVQCDVDLQTVSDIAVYKLIARVRISEIEIAANGEDVRIGVELKDAVARNVGRVAVVDAETRDPEVVFDGDGDPGGRRGAVAGDYGAFPDRRVRRSQQIAAGYRYAAAEAVNGSLVRHAVKEAPVEDDLFVGGPVRACEAVFAADGDAGFGQGDLHLGLRVDAGGIVAVQRQHAGTH